jgi:hypothetical protein
LLESSSIRRAAGSIDKSPEEAKPDKQPRRGIIGRYKVIVIKAESVGTKGHGVYILGAQVGRKGAYTQVKIKSNIGQMLFDGGIALAEKLS